MIYGLKDLEQGFDIDCDAVVVGSGAGGAVAAANLARAGMKVVVLEAGPKLEAEDMTRDAPRFLARYYWEGGLRMIAGTTQTPSMQARCLGGSTVVNSAIMLKLPDWVRDIWREETHSGMFHHPDFEAAYDRVFDRLNVAPTPMAVMGRRNLSARDAMEAMGIKGKPLPRAVVDCEGCADCLTGCANGAKQSVDRTYIEDAVADGADVYTCCHVEEVETKGKRATGVRGRVVDPVGRRKVAEFSVNAKLVIMAAGTMHTPVILQMSGINPSDRVGATLFAHVGGGMVGILDEIVEPWIGATQGWGAISEEIRGLKFESLWADPSVLMVRWGDVGRRFLEQIPQLRCATVIALVYRANVTGRVTARRNGMPSMRIWIPDSEAKPVLRGMKQAADGLLAIGARGVHTGIPIVAPEFRTQKETEELLHPKVSARHLQMTMNHVFGSCRMSEGDEGVVDEHGRVKGVENLYICDASIFPSPSAVNPQATIMAMCDLISRRLGELPTSAN
ncbi:MAG: FAD-dependent oxidoreductase [Polyangiaceae bacterium]